jgi:ribosomal RNA-processing protein 9
VVQNTLTQYHFKLITHILFCDLHSAFRRNTHQLLSASADRSVRVWNAADLSFVEALYGHQAEINAVDALYRDRAVTVSNDRSLRMWKIPEETQLVLKGHHKASLDCVAMIDEVHFVAGSQDGAMSLWHTSKKKPLAYVSNAHGSPTNWITSLASIHNTDVVVSGSNDGWVKLWQADCDKRTLGPEPVGKYKVPGFVNGLACGSSGRVILAATGQEHRLGRWERDAKGRNGIHVARLDVSLDTQRGGASRTSNAAAAEESSDDGEDDDEVAE